MTRILPILAALALPGLTFAAPAAQDLFLPVCGVQPLGATQALVIRIPTALAAPVAEVLDAIAARHPDTPLCAHPGAHAGAWVLDGTASAAAVAIVPAGAAGRPWLVTTTPRFRQLGPLTVDEIVVDRLPAAPLDQ